MKCLDDATVAVQLEPVLIKAIKKGGFFNHKPSTFSSLISSKENFVRLWQVTPSVNCIWYVNVCYVKNIKDVNKPLNTSVWLVHVVERWRSRVEVLDRTNTQSLRISEDNVLPP